MHTIGLAQRIALDGLDSVVDLAQLTLGDVLRVGLVHGMVVAETNMYYRYSSTRYEYRVHS